MNLAVGAGFALSASSVQAQSQTDGSSNVCEAAEVVLAEGIETELQIACGTAAVMLGRTDSHELIQLPSLNAAVALTVRQGTRRAWLVMKDPDGSLALEEITGTLARIGGRGARRDIDGMDIIFEDLNTGRLTALVRSQGRNDVTLDLAGMVGRSRAAREAASQARAN